MIHLPLPVDEDVITENDVTKPKLSDRILAYILFRKTSFNIETPIAHSTSISKNDF